MAFLSSNILRKMDAPLDWPFEDISTPLLISQIYAKPIKLVTKTRNVSFWLKKGGFPHKKRPTVSSWPSFLSISYLCFNVFFIHIIQYRAHELAIERLEILDRLTVYLL